MTSTTPELFKAGWAGRREGLMHNGEWRRGEYCRVLLVRLYTRRLLTFFLASGAPQEQVCAVVLYLVLSLSRAIPTCVPPSFFVSPSFPSLFYFVSLPPYALLSLRPICFARSTFSLYMRARRTLFIDSETQIILHIQPREEVDASWLYLTYLRNIEIRLYIRNLGMKIKEN